MRFLHSLTALLTAGLLFPPAVLPQEDAPPPSGPNIDFEDGDEPVDWTTRGDGYVSTVVTDEKHSGERALRLSSTGGGRFGMVYHFFPPDWGRGKRLKIIGYLKTAGLDEGWAGLWVRADGWENTFAYGGMEDRAVRGTTPWTRYEVAIDVPPETEAVRFGLRLNGSGTIWADSFDYELVDPIGPPRVRIRGIVRDAAGEPVAGAHVAAVRPRAHDAAGHTTSGADGRFTFDLPHSVYALTATAASGSAAFRKAAVFDVGKAPDEVALVLGAGGVTVSGQLRDGEGRPLPDVHVLAFIPDFPSGNLFFTTTGGDGRYAMRLPTRFYSLTIHSADYLLAESGTFAGQADETVDLVARARGPVPEEVVHWMRERAIPITTPEAGHGFEDLRPLAAAVGDAQVVGLGEATHGTREFFQLKHRIFEYLVEEMGFTALALEGGAPEVMALNEYVKNGVGDPVELVEGLRIWALRHQELLELVEWMRSYNADPEHEKKIALYGLDLQFTPNAAAAVLEYLDQVDPDPAASRGTLIEPLWDDLKTLRELRGIKSFRRLDKAGRDRLMDALNAALLRFDMEKERWSAITGERRWMFARRHMVIVHQAVTLFLHEGGGLNPIYGLNGMSTMSLRDFFMYSNMAWIWEQQGRAAKVAVWAHNGHVTRRFSPGFTPLGQLLARKLQDRYVIFGFTFHQGSFLAYDQRRPKPHMGVRQITVGEAPPDFVDAALARTGLPLLALDLRGPAPPPVTRWLETSHPMRHVGAVVTGDEHRRQILRPRPSYDVLLFVETTNRARLLQKKR